MVRHFISDKKSHIVYHRISKRYIHVTNCIHNAKRQYWTLDLYSVTKKISFLAHYTNKQRTTNHGGYKDMSESVQHLTNF